MGRLVFLNSIASMLPINEDGLPDFVRYRRSFTNINLAQPILNTQANTFLKRILKLRIKIVCPSGSCRP